MQLRSIERNSARASSQLFDNTLNFTRNSATAARRTLLDDAHIAPATELVHWAHQTFGDDLVLSSSFGADSAVMLHLVTRVIPGIRVVLIDTGYLFPETYQFVEELRQRLDFQLVVAAPAMTAGRQEALYGKLWEQGEEGLQKYLQINKVEPMERALRETGARAWLAGLRADQTEHRRSLPRVGQQGAYTKIHPILDWSRQDVESYLQDHSLPRHPLLARGYRSIGDWHSTVPSLGDDERSGRNLGQKKECGIHLAPSL